MKEKHIKFIFFVTIILCIGLGIYGILKNNTIKALDIDDEKIYQIIFDTINIGISEVDSINPLISNNQDVQYISKLIYNPLIEISENFELTEGLASEWSKLNEKTYLIKLKNDIYWHNGEKFTAEDLEYTINEINKNEESIYKENVKTIEKIEIIDEFTVKIYLKEETPFFEYLLCFPIMLSDENIGTGLYKIKEINEEEIILELAEENEDIKTKKIVIKIYDSSSELYTAFLREEIDLMTTTNPNFKEYIGNIGFKEQKICGREFDYIKINLENRILENKEVRQAINYAINKNEINYNVYNNYFNVANFPIECGSYLYQNAEAIPQNTSKAKQLLNENGWEFLNGKWRKGQKSIEIRLTVNKEDDDRIKVAEIIKEQLKEVGIIIEINNVSAWQYEKMLNNQNYELILTGNLVPIMPDISSYFEDEKEIEELKNIENKEVLKEKYAEIIKMNNEQSRIIGLYFNSNILIYNTKLKGNFSGNWYNIFYHVNTWYKTD